jgi:transposase
LAEYGIVMPQNLAHVRQALPLLRNDSETGLSSFAKELFALMYEELCALDERITSLEAKLKQMFLFNLLCQRISAIEGIGPVTATAVVAAISDGSAFHNGRQFAAWLGLVPRQHSSGDRQRLGGITKRGDPHLRTLLISVFS